MSDYDYRTIIRRDRLKNEFAARRWNFGFVADLPHPYSTSQGSRLCEVCGGHYDRRMHDPPWQKPIYGPCRTCAGLGDIECDVCAETRESWNRIGVEEVPSEAPTRAPAYTRRWWYGTKFKQHRRRQPKARDHKIQRADAKAEREAKIIFTDQEAQP